MERSDTGGVTEHEWQAEVEAAELAADESALRALFVIAQDLFGAEAPHRWAEVLSAYDSSAVTG